MVDNVMYIQTCIIGLGMLLIPVIGIRDRRSRSWRLFRAILYTVMLDLVFETLSWVLNGRFFARSYEIIYYVNVVTILLQSVMALLWLYFTIEKLQIVLPANTALRWLCALPMLINALLLLTNKWTGFVFTINSGHYFCRGQYIWHEVLITFSYPAAATVLALRRFRTAEAEKQRRDALTLASFMVFPIIGALLQLMFYGTFLFLVAFAFSLLTVFVNVQNDQITIDYLTKTNNRSSFMYYFERRIRSVKPPNSLYLFMIDVNNFKRINDTYGHLVGDKALIAIAEQLKAACHHRKCFLARLGGDEFAILLESERDEETEELTEAITECLNAYNKTGQIAVPLTVSVGCAKCGSGESSIDQIVKYADDQMYISKRRAKEGANAEN